MPKLCLRPWPAYRPGWPSGSELKGHGWGDLAAGGCAGRPGRGDGSSARPRCGLRLTGAKAGLLNFLMYPVAETAEGRADSYWPDAFRYAITAREVKV
jgi:hypothetical protein